MSHYRRDDTPGATWFFTVVTYRRQEILCKEAVRKSLREAIAMTRIDWPFQVDAWVLLPCGNRRTRMNARVGKPDETVCPPYEAVTYNP